MTPPEMPKDLGIKVATNKEEAAWLQIKEGAEKSIAESKRAIIISQSIIMTSQIQIKKEQRRG